MNGDAAGGSPTFDYTNLNDRSPTPLLVLARQLLPGVRLVAAQIEPYAEHWRTENLAALADTKPLWVVLGDSLSQGIGAGAVERGWVPLASTRLRAAGLEHRIVNLSFSGARIEDVIERQLPAMTKLDVAPSKVLVLIGSNDVTRRRNRECLRESFLELLQMLPCGSYVATMPDAAHPLDQLGELIAQTADRTIVAVPLRLRGAGRAEDHYHPDDTGHALMAQAFSEAILATPGN